jgi:hypothetical protein
MDIQKEFEKWFSKSNWNKCMNICAKDAWNACAMLMADRVKELEAEIREAFTDGCRQGHDEASESIFNAETRVREQLIQEIKPLIYKAYCEYGCSGVTSKPNNSCDAGEMKSCGGCYTWKTYQSILAKLDLLEKGGE